MFPQTQIRNILIFGPLIGRLLFAASGPFHRHSVWWIRQQSFSKVVDQRQTRMFSEKELRDMRRLRAEMADILTPDLNTDFNIHRWIHGWHGDIAEASRRFRAYIENRKAAHLDDPGLLQNFHAHPIITRFAPFFSFSINPIGVNPVDNTVVVIQRFKGVDYHAMTRVMTCGQFLSLYFVVCEFGLRQVLKCEAETGRKSGLIIVFDMDEFQLLHYANPHSAMYRIFMLCLGLLQDNYCDMLRRLLIVNAPTMLNMVLAIVKRFLNPVTQQKFTTVSGKEGLFKFLHPCVVPVKYGGQLRLASNNLALGGVNWRVDPQTCTLIPKAIAGTDYFVPRAFTQKVVIEHIAPGNSLEVRQRVVHAGSQLTWQFTTSSELKFTVVMIKDGQKHHMTPFWTVITPKLPEEGSIICAEPGEYALEFVNAHASWSHRVKVKYVVALELP